MKNVSDPGEITRALSPLCPVLQHANHYQKYVQKSRRSFLMQILVINRNKPRIPIVTSRVKTEENEMKP